MGLDDNFACRLKRAAGHHQKIRAGRLARKVELAVKIATLAQVPECQAAPKKVNEVNLHHFGAFQV